MKQLVCVLLLMMGVPSLFGQENGPYSEIRINVTGASDLRRLQDGGWHPDHVKRGKGYVDAVVNRDELELLRSLGASMTVLVADVEEAYAARPSLSAGESDALQSRMRSTSGISGFGFGSMGGYYTFLEVVHQLDTMAVLYPNLITVKDSIGVSIEGRPIWAVKISDNPNSNEEEPEVLYTGLHHAREPEGMMAVVYYMYHLLENYGTDPEVTYLVNEREMYFVPVVNPDGYVRNQTTNPGGGGMWRKNRRNNGGSYGVDLNRNYGYLWGYDNNGSSPYPSDGDYRGTAPFSEPETQAVRDFCEAHEFRLALNYHTYGNLLIYPWGYIGSFQTPDSVLFDDYTTDMTQYNQYVHGTGDQTVGYITNGDSDDWMYGEQTTKNKILSMTPEVGPSFWPPQDQIFPLAEENLYPNLFLAWAAGANPVFMRAEFFGLGGEFVNPGDSGMVVVSFQNKGLGAASVPITITLNCSDPLVTVLDASSTITGMDSLQIVTNSDDPFIIIVDSSIVNGYKTILAVESNYAGVVRLDTFEAVVGTPTIVFVDEGENTSQWNTGQGWGTHSSHYSGEMSLTDSPAGLYANNANNFLTQLPSFSLIGLSSPRLEFWTRWDIEGDWDFGTVAISTNGGSAWLNLRGEHAQQASGNSGPQSNTNNYGYDGTNSDFIKETIDLSSFAGLGNLKLRFSLAADGSVRKDGWYVDLIRVLGYSPVLTPIRESADRTNVFRLMSNYPNPFNPSTAIRYELPDAGRVKLTVFNVLGQEVRTLASGTEQAGRHLVNWDGLNDQGQRVASGVYVCRLEAGGFVKSRKMLLLK